MKRIAPYIFLLISMHLFCFEVKAQGENNIWYFGLNAGVDFNGGPPVALTNGQVNKWEGCSAISDSLGNLLFYTDGANVWNRLHTLMPNGTGLPGGNGSSTQAALIVRKPGSYQIYYIFTVSEVAGPPGLCYATVDMSLAGGFGDVVGFYVQLLPSSTEKLTAVKDNNGTDIWVAGHQFQSDAFKVFHVTAAGVNPTPVTSNTGKVHAGAWPYFQSTGAMKFSPDGTHLACCIDYMDSLQLFDFNSSTGVVSNPITVLYTHPYTVEFSPSGRYMYVGAANGNSPTRFLKQFDISSGNQTTIINSAYTIRSGGMPFGTLQLGPDHKIYESRMTWTYLSCITAPEMAGALCNFLDSAVDLSGRQTMLGLPNAITSDFYFVIALSVSASSSSVLCNGDCNGASTATPLGGAAPYSFSWSNGQTTQIATGLCAGIYTVTITDNTSNTVSTTITITQPLALVISSSLNQLILGDSTQLSVNISGTYLWSPAAGLSCSTCANPMASPAQSTLYCVQVIDVNGCTSSACRQVDIGCNDFFVPSAFSPNDDAVNDILYVRSSCFQYFSFSVYDRLGEKMFETQDINKGWDGNYRGEKMNNGIFVYFLTGTYADGKTISAKGDISLIR